MTPEIPQKDNRKLTSSRQQFLATELTKNTKPPVSDNIRQPASEKKHIKQHAKHIRQHATANSRVFIKIRR
jgi:hypothetical protein